MALATPTARRVKPAGTRVSLCSAGAPCASPVPHILPVRGCGEVRARSAGIREPCSSWCRRRRRCRVGTRVVAKVRSRPCRCVLPSASQTAGSGPATERGPTSGRGRSRNRPHHTLRVRASTARLLRTRFATRERPEGTGALGDARARARQRWGCSHRHEPGRDCQRRGRPPNPIQLDRLTLSAQWWTWVLRRNVGVSRP